MTQHPRRYRLAPVLWVLLSLTAVSFPHAARADITNVTWPDQLTFTNPLVVMSTTASSLSAMTSDTDVFFWVLEPGANGVGLANPKDAASLNPAAVELTAKMHIRGQSTAGDPKKQYSVKLTESTGGDNFLGMTYGGNHWVFNDAGVYDQTMIRNILAFDMQRTLGQNTGSEAWAPRTKYFELFAVTGRDSSNVGTAPSIDDIKAGYAGLYINLEEVRPEADRVPIPTTYSPVADGAVGGLVLQINDQHDDSKMKLAGGNVAVANTGNTVVVQWPEAADLTTAQAQTINDWYYNPDQAGPYEGWAYLFSTAPGYLIPPSTIDTNQISADAFWKLVNDYADLESFAEYFLLNEVAQDPDGYHRSTFMYREPDAADLTPGKLYAGPLWDKNKSYANPTPAYPSFDNTSGWSYSANNNSQAPWWWTTLAQYPTFQAKVLSAWLKGRTTGTGAFDLGRITTLIGEQQSYLESTGAYARDYELYYQGQDPNGPSDRLQTGVTTLTNYLTGRLTWLDNNVAKMGND